MTLSGKCFISSVLSRFWYYAFHRQCNPPSSFWTKNLSSDLHFNDLTNLLCVAASAIAYLMSNLFFVNTFWTLQLYFLCSIEVTSKIWTSIPLAKKFVRWTCSKSSLFARFFDDQNIYFFLTKPAVSIYYFLIMLLLEISGVYVWMLFSQFFPPDWESWNTVQAKLNSQIFAKQMNWSSVTFIYPARAL